MSFCRLGTRVGVSLQTTKGTPFGFGGFRSHALACGKDTRWLLVTQQPRGLNAGVSVLIEASYSGWVQRAAHFGGPLY